MSCGKGLQSEKPEWATRRYRVIWLDLSTNEEMISGHDLSYVDAEYLIRQGFWAKNTQPKIRRVAPPRKAKITYK